MKINVTAVNMKMTPDVSAYLDKKLQSIERLFTKHSDDGILQVELGKDSNHHQNGDVYEAKALLRGGGHEHIAKAEGSSLFAAIDQLKDELSEELSKEKDKYMTEERKGGRSVKELLRSWWPFGGE